MEVHHTFQLQKRKGGQNIDPGRRSPWWVGGVTAGSRLEVGRSSKPACSGIFFSTLQTQVGRSSKPACSGIIFSTLQTQVGGVLSPSGLCSCVGNVAARRPLSGGKNMCWMEEFRNSARWSLRTKEERDRQSRRKRGAPLRGGCF